MVTLNFEPGDFARLFEVCARLMHPPADDPTELWEELVGLLWSGVASPMRPADIQRVTDALTGVRDEREVAMLESWFAGGNDE